MVPSLLQIFGVAWARFLPGPASVANRPSLKFLERPLYYLNPGPFGLKEHVIAHTIATVNYLGSWAVDTFAVCKLFFHVPITPLIAIMGIFSITIFGAGLLGILSPMIIAPAEMMYCGVCDSILKVIRRIRCLAAVSSRGSSPSRERLALHGETPLRTYAPTSLVLSDHW